MPLRCFPSAAIDSVTLHLRISPQVAQRLWEESRQQGMTIETLLIEGLYLRLDLPLPPRAVVEVPSANTPSDPADRVLKALREMSSISPS